MEKKDTEADEEVQRALLFNDWIQQLKAQKLKEDPAGEGTIMSAGRALALAVAIQFVQVAIWATPGCSKFGFCFCCTSLLVPVCRGVA